MRLYMRLRTTLIVLISLFFLISLVTPTASYAQQRAATDKPFYFLMDSILSYFPSVNGRVVSFEVRNAVINLGTKDRIKNGMRLHIFKEDVSFVHPVTREFLGKVEKPIGTAEVIKADEGRSEITLLTGQEAGLKDALIKVSMNKIKALFYQSDINWFLADHYYQILKAEGRFELIDSAADSPDINMLSEEAKKKGAEIIIVMDSQKNPESSVIRQRVYWGLDGKMLSEDSATLDAGFVQSLIAKSGYLISGDSSILLSYRVSSSISRIAIADLDGDGSPEIILATANSFSVYQPSTDLKLLWEFKTPIAEQLLWIDTLDIDNSKRDSIVATIYKDGEVRSLIYQMREGKLLKTAEIDNVFMRRYGNGLIGQDYSRYEGYDSRVFTFSLKNGVLTRGTPLKLPERVNLYDFSLIESPEGKKGFIVWDERGFLNLYSGTGVISWSSSEDFGGFSRAFKRESPVFMIDRGEWTIKDRLISSGGGVLVPKRKPVLGMAKGLGYKESEIKALWWNGLSVEQISIVDKLDGELLDYGILNDRLIALCKPIMGVKASNILKGENPFVNTLYVISVRGIYN